MGIQIEQLKEKKASGKFDRTTGKWKWDQVKWTVGSDGLMVSNRHYPKRFWNRHWDRSLRDVAGVMLMRYTENYDDIEVFVVQCYGNKWGFPKGKINKGESFRLGAQREFYEESGTQLDLSRTKQLSVRRNDNNRKIIFFYTIESHTFDIKSLPIADDEITGFGWLPITRFVDYDISNVAKKVLMRLAVTIDPRFPEATSDALHQFTLNHLLLNTNTEP